MKVHSLAISGLLTMDLHALNNEGAEGNHLLTRMVYITDSEGKIAAVNAVSGDMFKHIQAEHLHKLAVEEKLNLCKGCINFNANRISADEEFSSSFAKGSSNTEILDKAIATCVIDDCEGILITSNIGEKKRAIPRKSVVEFSWVVGRPVSTRTESYFHVKYSPGDQTRDSESGNLGQNIFHRPASSGQYAIVLNVDLYRLGQNDISLEYAISDEERTARTKALLKSILFTFLKPTGAHRNTQNPHILGFDGVITASGSSYPAPVASPLNDSYVQEIEGITATLNRLKEDSVQAIKFDSLSAFAKEMETLIQAVEPYRVG